MRTNQTLVWSSDCAQEHLSHLSKVVLPRLVPLLSLFGCLVCRPSRSLFFPVSHLVCALLVGKLRLDLLTKRPLESILSIMLFCRLPEVKGMTITIRFRLIVTEWTSRGQKIARRK